MLAHYRVWCRHMNPEIILVLAVLTITILLFVTEAFRVDIIAVIIMLTLGLLGLVSPLEAFSGFASNAVISVMAVMILGSGIGRTGLTMQLARKIVRISGSGEKRLIAIISTFAGFMSAFMQNIGSAALFLPALLRISRKTKTSPSRMIMPMGFSAILGGTLSMVGSTPLIILNDLLLHGNLEPFGIFAVTPVGLALLTTGILYFLLMGRYVLPPGGENADNRPAQELLIDTWQLPKSLHHYSIPAESPLAGKKREEIRPKSVYSLQILAVTEGKDVLYGPWRYTVFTAGQILTLLGTQKDAERFAQDYDLVPEKDQEKLTEIIGEENAGFAEIIVRPHSDHIGKTLRQIAFRKNYGLEIIVFLGKKEEMRKDFFDLPLNPGDTFVAFGPWNKIEEICKSRDFVLTTPVEERGLKQSKGPAAVLCFAGGVALTFAGMPISLGLLTGAVAMVFAGVLSMDEAYRAIDWKIVFLLAGLIPLGIAMDRTGTALFISDTLMQYFAMSHPVVIMFVIAALTTFFSSFMSNVAATVLLVPLVIIIGSSSGIDPRALALLVGVCASNSFILPTHQVNAFLMTPGGYHNADYLKAGGIMSVLFLIVAVGLIYILFI